MLVARDSSDFFGLGSDIIPLSSLKDEIDSLGLSRSGGDSGSSGVGDGVLTSLLNEMDGVESLSGVVVVAATNRPESLVSTLRLGHYSTLD